MNVNHKLQLLDQMDDAAFALMMDEYAESEGERLRAEFEADMRSGLTPHKPDGLDDKCRTIIKKEYSKQRRREYVSNARRFATKAAAAVLIALGVTAATIMSVEAFRVPIWEFIAKEYDNLISFDFDKANPTAQKTNTQDPFIAYIPMGYLNVLFEHENGRYISRYENEEGNYVQINMSFSNADPESEPYFFEDDYNTIVTINGNKASYSTYDGILQVGWVDPELESGFAIATNGLSEDQFLRFCGNVADIFEDAAIDQPTEVPDALGEILPKDFTVVYSNSPTGLLSCGYKNESGQYLMFDMTEAGGLFLAYKDNGEAIQCTVAGYDAYLLKGEPLALHWVDTERGIMFSCYAGGLSEEDFMNLCEYLAGYYKNVTIPAISTVILP